jgi:hypothetical protein
LAARKTCKLKACRYREGVRFLLAGSDPLTPYPDAGRALVLARPGRDMLRLWPLPPVSPWLEDAPSAPRGQDHAFSRRRV